MARSGLRNAVRSVHSIKILSWLNSREVLAGSGASWRQGRIAAQSLRAPRRASFGSKSRSACFISFWTGETAQLFLCTFQCGQALADLCECLAQVSVPEPDVDEEHDGTRKRVGDEEGLEVAESFAKVLDDDDRVPRRLHRDVESGHSPTRQADEWAVDIDLQ